jgi:hypothetical protein
MLPAPPPSALDDSHAAASALDTSAARTSTSPATFTSGGDGDVALPAQRAYGTDGAKPPPQRVRLVQRTASGNARRSSRRDASDDSFGGGGGSSSSSEEEEEGDDSDFGSHKGGGGGGGGGGAGRGRTAPPRRAAAVRGNQGGTTAVAVDGGELQPVMLSFLEHLAALPIAEPFLAPVTEEEVPGYHAVIAQPMDLATMTQHVRAGKYRTPAAFGKDLRLIVHNAARFNPPVASRTRRSGVGGVREAAEALRDDASVFALGLGGRWEGVAAMLDPAVPLPPWHGEGAVGESSSRRRGR